MALQKESRKLHVKMINLSIYPTAYCYGHDTYDKMEEEKNTLSPKASSKGEYGAPALHTLPSTFLNFFGTIFFSYFQTFIPSLLPCLLPSPYSLSLPFSLHCFLPSLSSFFLSFPPPFLHASSFSIMAFHFMDI